MSDPRLVHRTVQIMRAVASAPDGIGLSDLARCTGLAKATCLRVMNALQSEGWVAAGDDRRFRLGLGLLPVVGGLLGRGTLVTHIQQIIDELAQQTGETAGFDDISGTEVTVLVQAVGTQLISQSARPVPRVQPARITSTGKVLLASLPDELLDERLSELFDGGSATGRATFAAELAEVRDRGWARTKDELEPGASSVAAPIPVEGSVDYAVWVGGPTFRFGDDRIDDLAGAVTAAAARLSEVIGALGPRRLPAGAPA